MTRDLLIGIDAGTSVLKAVAFTLDGMQAGIASRPNSYSRFGRGCVEQDMHRTWHEVTLTLADLAAIVPDLAGRAAALAVTGQGDGCWLIDAEGEPVGGGLIWLDSRAAEMAQDFVAGPDHAAHYATTGTGLNACQQSIQLAWLQKREPERLTKAATALHCKDWLYFKLTGTRAVDPSEAVFTYGDFRTRS
jgi:erythritol kinase